MGFNIEKPCQLRHRLDQEGLELLSTAKDYSCLGVASARRHRMKRLAPTRQNAAQRAKLRQPSLF